MNYDKVSNFFSLHHIGDGMIDIVTRDISIKALKIKNIIFSKYI